jgi:hypothetical protein
MPDAVFVANRLTRVQQASAEVTARIDVTADQARVDQQLEYDVQHVAMKELVFEAPNDLWFDEDQIEVALGTSTPNDVANSEQGETPLSIVPAPEDLEVTNSGATTRFRVPLPEPRLDKFSVHLRYQVPRLAVSNDNAAWQLPLVRPIDVQVTGLQARIQVPRGMSIALDAKADRTSWKPATADSEIQRQDSADAFVASAAETVLPLIVTASSTNPPPATVLDRIWLQSWYSGGIRQDRTAINFRTSGSQVTVELPELSPLSSAAEIEVLLDGEPAEVLSREEGRLVVRVAPSTFVNNENDLTKASKHTLELRSRRPVNDGLLLRHRLTPPLLIGGRELAQVYWQIVLPGDEHVIRSPQWMSSASRWQWLGSFWGRRPRMSQADLEKWSAASPQQGPTTAQNEYLYTGLASVSSIELITAPRWLIVLISSAATLAVGMMWVYVPFVRQGWIIAATACLVAGLAVAFPVPALLLAQAASLGVVAVLLALVVKRITSRPTHWPVTVSGGSSQRQVTPRTDSILMPPPISAASTAPTVPLRISDSQQ